MDDSYYQSLRIFICSPSDVKAERKIAEEVISNIDIRVRDTLGIRADCRKWEHEPPFATSNEETIQDKINEIIKNCHVFILILFRRYGSVERGENESNTEREVNLALKILREQKKIMFLSYFHELPPNEDIGPQEKKVIDLRTKLEKDAVLHKLYKDHLMFKDMLTHDLYDTILRFRLSTSKQKALRSFWQLGIVDGQRNPRLTIIYPPLNRRFMRQEDPDKVWLDRLVPNVVFEDFKALQKIDKTLRLVGFNEIETYSTVNYPADIQDKNRLWLCLPRNYPGLAQVNLYRDIHDFQFTQRKGKVEGHLHWQNRSNLERIKILSPLSKYLLFQRGSNPGGEWKFEHGRIIARDYAVLARFSDTRDRRSTVSGTLKDYFVAGLRGLGTWGAAWFLDRKYKTFMKYGEEEPIQLLLEVTYENENIAEVRDVSLEPQSYFDSQNQKSTIIKVIKNFQRPY